MNYMDYQTPLKHKHSLMSIIRKYYEGIMHSRGCTETSLFVSVSVQPIQLSVSACIWIDDREVGMVYNGKQMLHFLT